MLTLEAARAWYPEVDPVHGFDHIERVYRMAEKLARLEGADLEIVHAAALLHDSRGSDPNSGERLSHHEASARFAEQVLREEGWSEERIQAVQHCIRAHRYRGEQETNRKPSKLKSSSTPINWMSSVPSGSPAPSGMLSRLVNRSMPNPPSNF
jgi:uncharacterized protein